MAGQSRGHQWPIRFLFSALVLLPALLLPAIASGQEKVSFDRQIRSILSNNCYQCHGPDEKARQADLRLDLEQGMFADRDLATVKPGDRSGSELFQRISSDDADIQMPPPDSGKTLSKDQVELIGRWIDEGAGW
ncbi:MAG: c-type cytochrome domain-containing protein, partial [Pirellulaceae bacterium]